MIIKIKKIGINDLLLFMHVVILLMYTWRALLDYVRLFGYVFFISTALTFLNMIRFFCAKFKGVPAFRCGLLNIYILLGIMLFIFSCMNKGLLVSIMGMASCFLNMYVWRFSAITCLNDNSIKSYRSSFIKLLIFAMIVNTFIGLYQYFVDASVFGLVRGLYGDEAVLSSENVTRRVVGFMGSPQSYSASCGVVLFLSEQLKNHKIKFFSIVLIIGGGLLSGSRAFGIFLLLFLVYIIADIKTAKRVLFISGALIIIATLYFGGYFLSNETIARNFTFSRWAARSIYLTQLESLKWYEALFGSGFGLPGWNTTWGKLSFDYSSTESSIISFGYQLGIIPLIFLICFLIKGLLKNRNNRFCFFIILGIIINACFTPAFAGFAFSYIAWPILLMAYNGILAVNK